MLARARLLPVVTAVTAAALLAACKSRDVPPSPGATAGSASASTSTHARPATSPSTSASAGTARPAPPVRQGNVVARAPQNDALYVADEDHGVLRRIGLPADISRTSEIALPGRPAQVLATPKHVLVTIRDPGMLLVLRREGDTLVEAGRLPLPADAWGVATTPDGARAVVTSAWTHRVSVVALEPLRLVASVDVKREPRGVAIDPEGKHAWVSHLMGAHLTRVDGVDGDAPTTTEVVLPPSPLRAPPGKTLSASLGYSVVLSPDGSRLFAPRHALGAIGVRNWYGAPTVDVMELPSERPAVPPHRAGVHHQGTMFADNLIKGHGVVPFVSVGTTMVQPRAAVYRHKTDTLLVLSEGSDDLVTLDARSPDPILRTASSQKLGSNYDTPNAVHDICAAPSGIALSADEDTAYVFCRASYDLAIVSLGRGSPATFRLAEDPLGAKAEKGRRIFYATGDDATSGGLGCAGCHPEGRDDGFTWHEALSPETGRPIFVAEEHALGVSDKPKGLPRQTPMLAGHLDAPGPYGWHAQNPTLIARVQEGFGLHRWDGIFDEKQIDTPTTRQRGQMLAPFLLNDGLVPPPRDKRALTEEEERGKALFNGGGTGCAECHLPAKGYTDRVAHPLKPLPTRRGYAEEENVSFKTPGLAFVGGSAPYYHDGSVPTLEALIELNHDRMGRTAHLSKADRAALVAFLKTL